MRILKENINNINILIIRDIDIENAICVESLKKVIKKLTDGAEYYIEFWRESSVLDEEEIKKYRIEVPEYIKKNGIYILEKKRGKEHLASIGCIKITEEIYDQIIKMWKYFEGLSFFIPTHILNWKEFEKIHNEIKPDIYGTGIIQNKYANSVFIKGHDGDNLIFAYGLDFDKSLIANALKDIQ